ncbi:MAG: 2-hydroxychromene-2-carboxylate isomerase [Rhodospirillales bacterium]|nr:MAG: 2-hydroxychromene-2-carboxylate isomerase [Rhodospirillales bacterium]
MPDPIDFYFDFSSPYGYLAAKRIEKIAARHGRSVTWRPHLIGAVFPTTGSKPLLDIPLKGDYARRELPRTARRLGIPFRLPNQFPFLSIAAARAFYWLSDSDPAKAKALAMALYDKAFGAGEDISGAEAVIAVAAEFGVDAEALRAALDDPTVKARLKAEVDAAIARGVFGSPFIVIDGEPFWGHDKLAEIDAWLETGGW